MNRTQIWSVLTPVIAAIATYLASKVPLLDQATWNTLLTGIATSAVAGILGYLNRNSASVNQAATIMAANPQAVADSLSHENKQALAQATVAIAAHSETTKNALLESAITLPSVQGIVTDKQTEGATTSPLITATPHEIPQGT